MTTAGGIEEDFIKCLAHTYLGDFNLPGKELRQRGINRYFDTPHLWCSQEKCLFLWMDKLKSWQELIVTHEVLKTLLCADVRIVAHSCAVISRKILSLISMFYIIQHVDGFCLIFYTPLLNQGLGICWCPMTTTVNLRIGWCPSWTRWCWSRTQRWKSLYTLWYIWMLLTQHRRKHHGLLMFSHKTVFIPPGCSLDPIKNDTSTWQGD